jgi:acetoin utilization protein AcuB
MLVMVVKERMSPRFITIDPDASLAEARVLLDQHRIRHLPVVEDGNPVGIITDRDIRSAAPAASLEQVKVGEIMTRNLIMVTPSTRVQEAAKLMVTHRIGGLPVQREGKLVGIITETDLLKAFVEIVETATLERIAPDYARRTVTVVDL